MTAGWSPPWGDVARTVNVRSVRKSVLSALYGIGVAEGRIDLNRTLADLGIQDNEPRLTAAEREATIRDLLMSRSGVYHGAAYEAPGMAAARPPRGSHARGEFWYYNNWDFNALGTIYTRLTGESIFEAFDRRIAGPIGMEDYQGSRDGQLVYESVSRHPAYVMLMSARDLARLGLLYLNDGMWAGKQVIPSSWVWESTKRWSDASFGLGYGYMWWDLPSSLGMGGRGFAALGHGGQAVAVIPSRRLVVAHTADRNDSPVELRSYHFFELLRLIVAASPSEHAESREAVWQVIELLPEPLDLNDLLTDCAANARLVLEVACRREVVGVRMGIENPIDDVFFAFDMFEQRVSRVGRCRAGFGLEIVHRVDDRAVLRLRIGDDVLDAASAPLEKGGYNRLAWNRGGHAALCNSPKLSSSGRSKRQVTPSVAKRNSARPLSCWAAACSISREPNPLRSGC
jgi:CubicO group peptidase (beta-lactamase class C family)